jgi:hypothetical protein
MKGGMSLELTLSTDRLSYSSDNMMLHMTWLDVVWVSCYKGHVLALLIFKANLPTIQKLGSWLDVGELWILEWSLELSAHDVLQTVIRNDMVMSALVLDRDGLLHQTAFFELIAVDEGATESALLIGCQALGEVGVYLVHGVDVAW